MKSARRLLVLSVMFIQALLLALGATRHSPVMDEIAHLAAGVSNWELGRFDLYRVNPPLVRMLAALPVLAARTNTDYGRFWHGVGVRAEFAVMDDFVRANGERVIWLVTLARWGLIPVALLGGYTCYRWARELYGDAAGIVALGLWCFCPNVLTYGQIINADAGATALGVTGAYFFWKWLRDPAWDRAILAAIALGLAELTKTTWVVLFGLWPVLWFVVRGPWSVGSLRSEKGSGSFTQRVPGVQGSGGDDERERRRDGESDQSTEGGAARPHPGPLPEREGVGGQKSHDFRYEVAQLAAMLAISVLCINAGYDFEGSCTKLRNYQFVSAPLTGASQGHRGHIGNRFAKSWLGKLPVPLPKSYVEGIDLQWHDIEVGKPSYLRGRWQEQGWWYWYLYALAVKVPLGTWGLFLLAVGVRLANLRKVTGRRSQRHASRPHPGPLLEGEGEVQGPKSGAGEGNAKCKMQNENRKMGDGHGAPWRDELVLLAPAVVVLVLVSSQTGFSRYIRYVLPIFPFVFIWVSSLASFVDVPRLIAALQRCRKSAIGLRSARKGGAAAESGGESPHAMMIGVATMILLTWSIGSSLWYAPHWMSYFNELAGGPMGGPSHLIDAQVDWGQDLLYLKKWLDAHPDARPFGLVYFGPINPTIAGVDFAVPPKGALLGKGRIEVARLPNELKPGWYAVSVNFLYGYPHYIDGPGGIREWLSRPYYSYFRRFRPVATAGYSIYIYHLTAGTINNALRDQARKVEGRQ